MPRKQFSLACVCTCMFAIPLFATDVSTQPGRSAELTTLQDTLQQWSVQTIDGLPTQANGRVPIVLDLNGELLTVDLAPYSLRSARFEVWVQDDSGLRQLNNIPAPATYRGHVQGFPGSVVAASIINGQLSARIDLGQDDVHFVEPLAKYDATAGQREHVVYHADDTIATDHVCGQDLLEEAALDVNMIGLDVGETAPRPNNGDRQAAGSSDKLVEVAFDADFEFYQDNGSSVANTIKDIENVMNGVEAIYQSDVQICYDITRIIVRTTSADPYTTNDPNGLLNEFLSHWTSSQGSVQRDTAHLMTGKNTSGGVIGIAYLTVICSQSFGYGVSWSRYTFNLNNRIALTAHELGHNWSAGHCCASCSGCSSCRIMCPCLGGCSGIVTSFGSSSISAINNHKNSRTCLDDGCEETMDMTEMEPGIAGVNNTVGVRGAAPNATVGLYYSNSTGSSSLSGCGGVTLGLNSAQQAGTTTADSNGNATFGGTISASASGNTFYLQMADLDSCTVSEVVSVTFP